MLNNPQELATKIKHGDQAAFRQLIEGFHQYAFALTFRILCDEEEAKDAVQEGFIKIWEKICSFDPSHKFTTWISRIFTNSAIDRLRSIKRHNLVRLDQVPDKLEMICAGSSDTKLDNQEMAQLIRSLAGDLPEKQQLVFILRDIQGMESSEVQEVLDLSETVVKSNLYHARKRIRRKLIQIITYEGRVR